MARKPLKMPKPEATAEKSQTGKLLAVTVKWQEAHAFGFIEGFSRRSKSVYNQCITSYDIFRSLRIQRDGILIAENGLSYYGFKHNHIPQKKPALVLQHHFHDIQSFECTPYKKWHPEDVDDNFVLTAITRDGSPIILSWSALGPDHFLPVVNMLGEVFDRMRDLVPPNDRKNVLDDIFQ